ncbi:hypothetical protein [Amycolatopsis australiensis]|uniref:Uncharacterized protein n=1 Tax=Amycolatopsis australiensis TaxID=546364 RepID=A0A1K1T194_9PSEU|nr:hypothetical protein [Amycolatopsis australiensis]SFW90103.1 hypothetical protein SAMN04489730_7450 [Amycolatopsis australiensis]
MSTLRRLALAGAFALPISLVVVAPSSAGTLGGPYEPWSSESSASFAGIGGAGTTESEAGSDWWGHHWSETDTSFAGIGGAAVTHHEDAGDDCDDWNGDDWNGDDGYDHGWTGHWTSHPAVYHAHGDDTAVTHTVSHPDAVAPVQHVTTAQPVVDTDTDDDASYVHETHSAGVDGATSAHVASHAGDDYATYEAGHLAAGPDGASSAGVHAVAVPGYAGYHNWYTAAGEAGTAVHSVTSIADANDHDWADDYGYDAYDG